MNCILRIKSYVFTQSIAVTFSDNVEFQKGIIFKISGYITLC